MSVDIEQIANNILAPRETRRSRFAFFRSLRLWEVYTVNCAPNERHQLQSHLCMAKWWYEKKLQAKFITRRVPTGVRVERVE